MRTLQIALSLTVVASLLFVPNGYAQKFTQLAGPLPPGGVALVYDPSTGGYTVVTGEDVRVTTWQHKVMNGLFNCDNIADGTTAPPFDICSPDKLFKLSTDGFDSIDFGNIAPTGLNFADWNGISTISGSLFGGGGLDSIDPNSPYICCVPEPTSLALLAIGLLIMVRERLRRFANACDMVQRSAANRYGAKHTGIRLAQESSS